MSEQTEHTAVLEQHRDELMAIEGVIGSGIGEHGIQVFVASVDDVERVSNEVWELLGGAPATVIVSNVPEAGA